MTLILAFLGTGLGKIVVGIFAAIIAAGGAYLKGKSSGKQSERDKQRAKEADAYEQHLRDIEAATAAANRVRPDDGGMQHDPNNRDNAR